MRDVACEALIVGGGLAGSTLAILLAKCGREVTLIEKEAGPHDKVCGEFLSYEAISYLDSLGLSVKSLGAETVDSICLVGRTTIASSKLPFSAASLSRKRLDESLLSRAQALGVKILRGRRVQSLFRENGGWKAEFNDGESVFGNHAFLATGKHDLHEWKRPVSKRDNLVAFKMHWRLSAMQTLGLNRRVELILFPGGYGGLELVEDNTANLCFLIEREALRKLDAKWEKVLDAMQSYCPHFGNRLAGAVSLWERPLALSAIPYGYVLRHDTGLWRLGDQAAVIPSFTGDGMSIALHSAFLAASMYSSGATSAEFHSRLHRDVSQPVYLATVISRALISNCGRSIITRATNHFPLIMKRAAAITRIPESNRLNATNISPV